MKDGNTTSSGGPDAGRPFVERRRSKGPRKQRGFVERATASGHSGYGSESVRPHLRDQLKLKALMPQPFPTPEQEALRGKDEHHQ